MLTESQATELLPTTSKYLLNKYQALATVSPEIVLQRPMLFVVENALLAAASESENTERAYRTAIGLFLQYVRLAGQAKNA